MSGDHAGTDAVLAARVRHVEGLLEARGLVDPVELDRALTAFLAQGSPAVGAGVVARACLDEGFRGRLLQDPIAALPEVQEAVFRQQAGRVAGGSPADFATHIRREYDTWAPVIREAGIRAE